MNEEVLVPSKEAFLFGVMKLFAIKVHLTQELETVGMGMAFFRMMCLAEVHYEIHVRR